MQRSSTLARARSCDLAYHLGVVTLWMHCITSSQHRDASVPHSDRRDSFSRSSHTCILLIAASATLIKHLLSLKQGRRCRTCKWSRPPMVSLQARAVLSHPRSASAPCLPTSSPDSARPTCVAKTVVPVPTNRRTERHCRGKTERLFVAAFMPRYRFRRYC